jgi:uncharacterized protein
MRQQLPREIDPFRLAQNGLKLAGELRVSSLKRLVEYLSDDEGTVNVDMHFDVDETGTPFLRAKFSSTLNIICERCSEKMTLNVEANCLLALVRNEHKIEGLAEQYEPWLIDDNNEAIKLASVVEDELILVLPLVPKHDFDCLPAEAWQSGEGEVVEEKPVSPFAVLSALKSKD